MKKRVIIFAVCVVLIVIGMVAALVACSENVKEVNAADDYSVEGFKVISFGEYKIVIDNETGVEYLLYRGVECVTITPLYNADGTLKVYKEEQE